MKKEIISYNNEKCTLTENEYAKVLVSDNFHNIFMKHNGKNLTWGKAKEDNPDMCQFGPLIADIEISTICHGPKNSAGISTPCKFCYKSNTGCGKNMTLEEFKVLFHKLPRTLTQIAFGIGDLQDLDAEMWKIFEYCRKNDYQEIIPNITINGNFLTDEKAHKLKELMGAVAVSNYNESCYDAVEKLTNIGMTQINIHQLLSENTYYQCMKLIDDIKNDKRLKKLNAVVFLMLKPKGKRNDFQQISEEHYRNIVNKALENYINFGFDSCSANSFNKVTNNKFKTYSESCESTLFSSYFNVDGKFFPCSFCEGENGWEEGLEIKNNFLEDIWYNERVIEFRNKLLKGCRNCPMFKIGI